MAYRLLGMLMALLCSLQPVRAAPVDAGNSVAELIAERSAIVPGDRFLVALHLEIDEGWHVYWRNAGDAGLGAEIYWKEQSGSEVGDFIWPAPHAIPLFTLMNYGYEDELVLPFEVAAPSDLVPNQSFKLSADVEWQICLDICIVESAELTLELPVAEAPDIDSENSLKISESLSVTPSPMTGTAAFTREGDRLLLGIADTALVEGLKDATELRFYPYDHEIEHAFDQIVEAGPAGATITLQQSMLIPEEPFTLEGIIVLENQGEFISALEVVADETTLPTGISGAALGSDTAASSSLSLSKLAIWLGFGLLGGLILNVMPCVLPVLAIKANSIMHAAGEGAGAVSRHGLIYTLGVLACFLSIAGVLILLRAGGEQIGLGFQLQYPPVVLGLALVMYLVGLNLLGVFEIGSSLAGVGSELVEKQGDVGAFFTGLLAAVAGAPCVGPFLAAPLGVILTSQPDWLVFVFLGAVGLGMAAPFLLISIIPGLAGSLPKPGPWMNSLKKLLAIPMFLTAIYLVWILSAQTGTLIVVAALLGALIIGCGFWLSRRSGAVAILLGLFLGAGAPLVLAATNAGGHSAQTTSILQSERWSPERVEALLADGKPVFVDFTARWCVTCQLNKSVALETSKVKDIFEKWDVKFLVADWTNRDPIIAKALADHDRAGVPLYLFYSGKSQEPVILPQLLSADIVSKTIDREMNGH